MCVDMKRQTFLGLTAALLLASTATAQVEGVVEVELLPGWREGERHIAGLQVTLAPGWKTYWRAPGDAGIPPVFDWSGSENVSGFRAEFPVPHVFDQAGMRSIGYQDDVLFPLIFETIRPGDPILLSGEVTLGVCKDICIPVDLRLSAQLPAGGTRSGPIAAALSDRAEGGEAMACALSPIADGLRVEITMAEPDMGETAAMVIETADPSVWVSEPVVLRQDGRISAVSDLVPPDAAPFALARDGLRVTFLENGRAIETVGCD